MLKVKRSHKNPTTPAITEARRMAILELFIIVSSSNARSVMKMDIVKPIPPRQATAISIGQEDFAGISPT